MHSVTIPHSGLRGTRYRWLDQGYYEGAPPPIYRTWDNERERTSVPAISAAMSIFWTGLEVLSPRLQTCSPCPAKPEEEQRN